MAWGAQRDRAKKRTSPFFLIGLGLVVIGAIFGWFRLRETASVISPLADEPPRSFNLPLLWPRKDPVRLRQQIMEVIGDTWKNYSVLVIDYTQDFSLRINESVVYTGASVNKLPIMAAIYYLAQKGEVDLDQTITLQAQDIQDYGTGAIRYDPPGTTYSVKTLARLMMQKSDNTAAFLLGNYVAGIDKIQNLVNSWGLTQTDMANNKTSNRDMAILMEKIFKERLANPSLTQEMIAFLKDSDTEDRIPALLPKDVLVYHKTGDGIGNIHDVGIVVHGKTKYYLGILTSDITDEEQAKKLAARVSRTVYNYMK